MDGVPPAGHASSAPGSAKHQVRPDRGPDPGRFRAALARPVAALGSDAEAEYSATLQSRWFRAERLSAGAPAAPSASARTPLVDRLLVGEGPRGPEARLRISAGALAGTEIRLTAAAGTVEVQLLTPSEGSRQTLIVAMEAIRERLRVRGIVLAIAGPAGTSGERRPVRSSGGRR